MNNNKNSGYAKYIDLMKPIPEDIIVDPVARSAGFLVEAGEYLRNNRNEMMKYTTIIKIRRENMDGKRIQEYWSNEMKALLDTYRQFQILTPAEGRNGAAHNGEDGRYVETLIKEYLKKYLPKD